MSLPQAFLDRLALKGLDSLLVLARVVLPDGTILRRAFLPYDVTFGGEVYAADAGGFDSLRQTIDEESAGFRVAFQNVDGQWVARGNVNGALVTVLFADRTLLDDPAAVLESGPWYATGPEVDPEEAVLPVGTAFDALSLETLQPSVVSLVRATDRDGTVVRLDYLPHEVRV